MNTTTKTAGDIRIDIDNLNADIDTLKVAFTLMMGSNDIAMMAPATSDKRWDHILLRNQRQHFLLEDLDTIISGLQGIKDSVENLWN